MLCSKRHNSSVDKTVTALHGHRNQGCPKGGPAAPNNLTGRGGGLPILSTIAFRLQEITPILLIISRGAYPLVSVLLHLGPHHEIASYAHALYTFIASMILCFSYEKKTKPYENS